MFELENINRNYKKKNCLLIIVVFVLFGCDNKKYYANFNGANGVLRVDRSLKIDMVYLCLTGPDTIFYFQAKSDSLSLSSINLYDTSNLKDLEKKLISNEEQSFSLRIKCFTKDKKRLKRFTGYYDTKNLFQINDTLESEGYR